MKKQILLLAGSALILASCGSNNNANQQAADQAKIDSITKANAALQEAANKQKNDSTINAMAKAKADSMEAAKHEPAAKHATASHKKTEVASPAPVQTAQDTKFQNRQQGNANPTISPAEQQAQDDKFKRRGK